MSGYVEAGYVIGLGTLAGYASLLVARERAARRRLARLEPVPREQDAAGAPGAGAT
ncbi:MAG TPA: hypothetical protein VMV02_02060 [Acidimicrobiales bacterium]|nr:hypothetical protein [Acidimicrobiales bacterium]